MWLLFALVSKLPKRNETILLFSSLWREMAFAADVISLMRCKNKENKEISPALFSSTGATFPFSLVAPSFLFGIQSLASWDEVSRKLLVLASLLVSDEHK